MKNLTRRSFIGAGAAATMAAALAGCSSGSGSSSAASASASAEASASASAEASAAATGGELRFVTGGAQGTYYGFGQVLATHAKSGAGLSINALTSDGSKANVESIEDGLAEFGFCQADVMAYAYEGTNIFEGMPIQSFSTVAALYDEQIQIVTCDPEITSIDQLKGQPVSIGAPNSGVYFNAVDVLAAYDMTVDDIQPTYQNFGDSTEALKNDQIKAAFVVAGAPTTSITDLSASKEAYLISLDEEHVNKLLESPYYVKATIPAGTYGDKQAEDVQTIAVSSVIIAANTVADDDVYAFVKDIFDATADEKAAAAHDKYKELDLDKAASITAVPYHPGAKKYFEEQGKTVQ